MIEEDPPRVLLSVPAGQGPGVAGFVAAHGEDDQTVTMTYTDVPGPWIFFVEGKMVRGKVAITTLTITQRDSANPRPINQAELRHAPIGTLLDRVKSALQVAWNERVSHLAAQVRTHLPKQGRSRPPEHYMQVAWFYTYAELTGQAPRKVVTKHWGVSPVTASRWLAEARRRGYLPDYQPGTRLGEPTSMARMDPMADLEACNRIERQIFLKVYRELVLRTFDQKTADQNENSASHAGRLLAGALHGNSDGARRLRAEICFQELLRLAKDDSEEGVRIAAATLVAALLDEQHAATDVEDH